MTSPLSDLEGQWAGTPHVVGTPPVDVTATPGSNTFHDLSCRCLPNQPCWPSADTWQTFSAAVGGRLIATTPPARACHNPFYDSTKCWEIQKGYFEDSWRQLQPGAMTYTNWETYQGEGCLGTSNFLSPPCRQGAVPLFTVNASTATDIQETVRFAAKHNLRLVIKNTGHDMLGRSTAPNSLSLWVHHRKKMEVVDAFVPKGAPQDTKGEPAVLVESGVQFEELNTVLHEHNRIVVGGSSSTVGAAGGYCTGGGNGVLSKLHGLCVDNVLQYTIVTADGELRVANAYQNQDLFWALRGGGPGTFGVVVEAVMRTHPALKNIIKAQVTIVSLFGTAMDKIMREFLAHHNQWGKEGWSGYAFNVHKIVHILKINYYLPDGDLAQSQASIEAFVRYARSFLGVIILQNSVESLPSYLDAVPTILDVPIKKSGVNFFMGSRLAPQTMFESSTGVDALAAAIKEAQRDVEGVKALASIMLMFIAGGQVSQGNSQDTSVLPAWRSALMVPAVTLQWNDDVSYQDQLEIQRALTKAVSRLRAITPGSGSYLNEADPNEPDWQDSFFGANYPRLRQIKHKYDPQGIFICRKCVGSEDWDDDLMCPRRQSP
ncbi:hypothetical protein BGZ59_002794 [Podila verticillata]|nr:hypothetical protein BGZ59_002794 [Podila verticillata]KFH73055.1 hypothetical protein MVEG_00280 [Podila verticillata NRRL 6337]